jgi:hypothetical protein
MRVTRLTAATFGCAIILSSLAAPAIADSSAPNNKLKASVMARGQGSVEVVKLTPGQEVPGPGDVDGHGTFVYTIKNYKLCYRLSVGHIDKATAAHIHFGDPGESGNVVVPLKTPNPNTDNVSKGCIHAEELPQSSDVLTVSELVDIKENSSRYYVNVHNNLHPAGAIRGQL